MVTKEMLVSDVLKMGDVEQLAEVFFGYGMHCLGCILSHGETIEQAAAAHGVDADELIKGLNAVVEK